MVYDDYGDAIRTTTCICVLLGIPYPYIVHIEGPPVAISTSISVPRVSGNLFWRMIFDDAKAKPYMELDYL